MKIRGALIALLLGSILSAVALTPAAAKELVKVIIVGPGLNDEVEITDPEQVRFFDDLLRLPFIDEKPEGLSAAFFEIRMAVGSEGEIVAYNVYHYYPAQGDVAGYFYYAGVLEGSSSAEGKWFPLAEDGDRELREFLVSLGAPSALIGDNWAQASGLPIASSQQSGIESAGEQAQVAPLAVAIGLLLVLVLVSAAVLSRRKSPSDDQYP